MTLWRLGVVAASKRAGIAPAGYVFGGFNSVDRYSDAQKLTFSTDTFSTIPSVLSVARERSAGVRSATDIYILGGGTPSAVSNADKFNLTTETGSTFTSVPTPAFNNYPGGFYSSTKGYWVGNQTNVVRTLTFSTETYGTASNDSLSTRSASTTIWGTTHGYIISGFNDDPSQSFLTGGDKWAFSDDSRTGVPNVLSPGRYRHFGYSSPITSGKGYYFGGNTGTGGVGAQSSGRKLTFSDDSTASTANGLSANKGNSGGFASTTHGYCVGNSFGNNEQPDKFALSDDTRTSVTSTIANGRYRTAMVGNVNA